MSTTSRIVEGDTKILPAQQFFNERALAMRYALQYMNPVRAIRIADRYHSVASDIDMRPIELVFTTDVEYTPPWNGGPWIPETYDQVARSGLDLLLKVLREFNVKGTFLVEGALAQKEPGVIESILGSNGAHEIGYHGWGHESYGGPWETKTKVAPKILSPKEAFERIDEGVDVIRRQVGKAPTAFVAPFHHARLSTVTSLARLGFKADSSVYNHVYGLKEPFLEPVGITGIVEIPFAVPFNPIVRHGVSPFYPTLLEFMESHPDAGRCLGELRLMSDSLPESAERLVLLITCHPWEFTDEWCKKALALRKLLVLVKGMANRTLTMSEVKP